MSVFASSESVTDLKDRCVQMDLEISELRERVNLLEHAVSKMTTIIERAHTMGRI